MKATGLFFLTGRPSLVHMKSPAQGDVTAWGLPLIERTGKGTQHVRAFWLGTEGASFVQIHAARLKSGQALKVELDRVRPDSDGLWGYVTSCELAPDRWPKTEIDPTATTSQQPQRQAA